jgi:hypothetical protein
VQDQAAHQLDIKMPHPQHPPGSFTHNSKGFRQKVIQGLTPLQPFLEDLRFAFKLFLGQPQHSRFLLNAGREVVVPWEKVRKLGVHTVLVEIEPQLRV